MNGRRTVKQISTSALYVCYLNSKGKMFSFNLRSADIRPPSSVQRNSQFCGTRMNSVQKHHKSQLLLIFTMMLFSPILPSASPEHVQNHQGPSPQFSLYLDQKETLRLLGLPTEIYYIKDGTVDSYPLSFVMLIPTNVSLLTFSWENQASLEIQYKIMVTVTSNMHALQEPRLSIPVSGTIPHRKELWRLELLCTGETSAEVDVSIAVHASTRAAAAAHRHRHKDSPRSSSSSAVQPIQHPHGPTTRATGGNNKVASSAETVGQNSIIKGTPSESGGTYESSTSFEGRGPDIVVPLRRRKVCVKGVRDTPRLPFPASSTQGQGRQPTGSRRNMAKTNEAGQHHQTVNNKDGHSGPVHDAPWDDRPPLSLGGASSRLKDSISHHQILSDADGDRNTKENHHRGHPDDLALLASPSDLFLVITGSIVGSIFVAIFLGFAVYWRQRKPQATLTRHYTEPINRLDKGYV